MKAHEVPFSRPHLPRSILQKLSKVLESGWITTGPKTKEFENEFGKLVNSKFNIAVSSCTAALHLAYLVIDLKPGDEVIVPSFTFCSTVNMIVHTGATPVFCDIDESTLCLDPKDVVKKITSKTKAIVVVHFAGMPADMDQLNKIAKDKKLIIIEDAAHAFLTKYKNKYIGNGKNITCFSFYATKNLTTVEGGLITTSNTYLADKMRILSMHGISRHAWNRYAKNGSWKYDVLLPGYKYNMPDLLAVIGIEQLKVAKKSREKRLKLVKRYFEKLSRNKHILLPINPTNKGSEHAWHLFTIRIQKSAKINRDELIEKLKNNGIGTSVHFIPNHWQRFYRQTSGKDLKLPATEKVFESIISLPLYEDMSLSDVVRSS